MTFYLHEEAQHELEAQADFYESCRLGLGSEFTEEVYAAIARIVRFPAAWSLVSRTSRRCLINRFPFGIVYRVVSDEVQVLAIADLRRAPGYWRHRQ